MFSVQLSAALEHIAIFRHKLTHWLGNIAVERDRLQEILLATNEAVTNAVEHGSRCDTTELVTIRAHLRDDTVTVTVTDGGRWIERSAPRRTLTSLRGRGMLLIHALANKVEIDESAPGTQITMQFDVSGQH